jgi:adenylosuccinate lyase
MTRQMPPNVLKPFDLPAVSPPQDLHNVDPLDGRYFDAEAARYLSEQSRVTFQAYAEAALAHTLAEYGICSAQDAEAIEQSARSIRAIDVYTEELQTKHDVKALVNCIKRGAPESARPYVHFGATSYDIVATASALQMRTTMDQLVIPRLVWRTPMLTPCKLAVRMDSTLCQSPLVLRSANMSAVLVRAWLQLPRYQMS